MRHKRAIALLMAGVLTASMVSGCGSSSSSEDTSAAATEEATEEAATEAATEAAAEETTSAGDNTITVSATNDPGMQAAWTALADAYMEQHPDVNVVVDLKASDNYDQWVQTAFTSEDPAADIVNINYAGDVKTGKSINFAEYVDNDSPYSDGTWGEQFDVSKQAINMADNSFDALSVNTVQVIWLYNADIFEEVGVEAPTTWDELIDVCEKIQAAGYQPIAMDGDYTSFYSQTMGWLAQIYADQTNRSDVEVVRAQEGDYCYDPDIDGTWSYDPTDPYNDDSDHVTQNVVRAFAAIKDGTRRGDTEGMKTVWTNFAKVFPQYVGGDAFFGTNFNGAKTLFYQGKAAMMVNIASGIVEFNNDMKTLEAGEAVNDNEGNAIENVQQFTLGTFNMPSMEGEGIEAEARTIEVATGFLGCISKSQEHDDLVVDFLMYYSSAEGQSVFINAGLEDEYVPNGQSLVYGVTYPDEIQSAFDALELIGNVQKDFNNQLARGIGESADNFREFYEYSYEYLTGEIDVDTWAEKHEENIMSHVDAAMAEKGVGESDLANPQNEPTGN